MLKILTVFLLALLTTWTLHAQLKLDVEGPASIRGNLVLGDPEASISGLDMLVGVNDLRFSAELAAGEQMRLTPAGWLGIGTISPNFKLHVEGETQTVLGLANTSAGGHTFGIYSLGASNSEGAGNFMIRDETAASNRFFISTVGNVGIGTIQPNAEKLRVITDGNAAYSIRADNENTAGPEQTGIYSSVRGAGSGTRLGVSSLVDTGADAADGQHFAVYGRVASQNASNLTVGVIGIDEAAGAGAHYAGYFIGDAIVTGTFDNPSDEKLKTNVRSLDQAVDRLMALHPVSYEFRTRDYPQMRLAQGPQMGFIAQEMARVFPELVKDNRHPEMAKTRDEEGRPTAYYPSVDYKGVNYSGLIPVLTRATQEQQQKILDLESQVANRDRHIAGLEDRLAKLEAIVAKLAATEDGSTVVPVGDASLLQNQPNPFTETTSIVYTVPTSVRKAELRITDAGGRLLKTVVIDQRGEGRTQLQAQSLSAGTYFYSLVLDGKVQSTRKMVLTPR
ncbi:tail fiber domain-containing protein [Flavilitoribacter nigricans]|uniref:Peptidase S74 domain-containing protein n=1 Tax=Flavilitoribacter nigricans (strain ATCC 23147 / DSM 23189 / NBRC 102662 / NCIMB 1420 / SS-2) TaxID=1122177 RepID=A0A2D0N6W2_FLAN2|nr:tail fiber domain-containing protein [Flavilitoribacter nigricans]PHN03513.1 hypothetical protein CRP01_26295 [Flavilitoribacter nigricans DSM 23189 = NBRC 102662]